PYVLFVGRVTNQKGVMHFMNMIPYLPDDCQAVLYAGSPDTPQIENQLRARIAEMQKDRGGVFWINRPISLEYKRALYSHATVFCCPSIYEPFGIINLEAMACETPVVASAVGGIKEVVKHNETGFLVPVDQEEVSLFELPDDLRFAKALSDQIRFLMDSPSLRKKMGKAGRQRALKHFSWSSIARKTAELYESLTEVPQDKPTYQIDKLYADPA
ncbi:glycosyltransferase family 4 protein, partial [Omnitrophica bacterium]|nr:glycosyltransferase family 4 protein [Candidatus Omnitrophota bacterium]